MLRFMMRFFVLWIRGKRNLWLIIFDTLKGCTYGDIRLVFCVLSHLTPRILRVSRVVCSQDINQKLPCLVICFRYWGYSRLANTVNLPVVYPVIRTIFVIFDPRTPVSSALPKHFPFFGIRRQPS